MNIIRRNNKKEYELPFRKFIMLPILLSSIFGVITCIVIFKLFEFLLSGAYLEGVFMTLILIGCYNSLHYTWFLTAKETVSIDPKTIIINYKFYGISTRKVLKTKNIKTVEIVNLNNRIFGNSYKDALGYSDIKIVIKIKWIKNVELGKYIDLENAQRLVSEINKQQTHNNVQK